MPQDEDYEDDGNDMDLEDWHFTQSGHVDKQPVATAPPTGTSSSSVALDSGLYNVYGLEKNWTLAPELSAWLRDICDKEVPFHVLKHITEDFVPDESFQSLFVAPALLTAISNLMYTVPKHLSRVPKLVNSTVLRAQK